jgi:hypothetical protein
MQHDLTHLGRGDRDAGAIPALVRKTSPHPVAG